MLQWEREITVRFLAEPTGINFEGKVRGGAVMKWIDQAGYPRSSMPRGSWGYARVSRKGGVFALVYALNETEGVPVMDVKAVHGRSVGRCP